MSEEINKTNALDMILSAGNECVVLSQKKSDNIDYDIVYYCIPEEERHKYGDSKEEQCLTFMKNNPDIFGELDLSEHFDFSTDDSRLNYIVFIITMRLGLKNIAYKGGYILNKLIPNNRKTYDIDYPIVRKELYEDIKIVLVEIANILISKNIIDNYEIKNYISETFSGGIKFIKDSTTILGADIGLHSLGYGITSIRLDFIDVNRFAVERSLSDKISVICSRKRFRRVKDLYDTYMLISLYNINGNILTECLSHRDVNFELMPIDETVIVQLKNAYDKLTLGSPERDSLKPDFKEVYFLVISFISGCKECADREWSSERKVWK